MVTLSGYPGGGKEVLPSGSTAEPSEGVWNPRPAGRCDQEVNDRTHVAPHKIREDVAKKETRHHVEPCDVQVSPPSRADASSEVRSSGDHVPISDSLDLETDEGRKTRLNTCAESIESPVQDHMAKEAERPSPKGYVGRTASAD